MVSKALNTFVSIGARFLTAYPDQHSSMQLCVSIAISMWYFTRDKSTVGNHTFFQAFCVAFFYHLGTCAFESLIIGENFMLAV